jgi:predicted dehydrogenase
MDGPPAGRQAHHDRRTIMVRWGIIGCGAVTEVKSGPAFAQVAGSELVMVMRRNRALAEDYAARHHVPRATDDADEILSADDVDAVYIATHPDTHAEYTLRAAAAGKAVYVEKPMARTVAECEEMIEACRTADVPLWVGYYRRRLPRFLAVRDLVADGVIGEVRGCTTLRYEPLPEPEGRQPWQLDVNLSGGGLFFDGVCHLFDYLDLLFGPVESVAGVVASRSGRSGTEDTVSASFQHDTGVVGNGFWCYAADSRSDRTTLFGSKGRLTFSTQYPDPILIEIGDRLHKVEISDPPHVHEPLVASIVGELNGADTCPSTGETALRTARVMEKIMSGFRAG